ncbi:MAG: methylated-DNA--[protein]-cysteine S-methyltransferase [Methanobacterium formicicum]
MGKKNIINSNPKKIMISICRADDLFFAVGVSPETEKIVRIFLPQSGRELLDEQISHEFTHFELTEKYNEVVRNIIKIYQGQKNEFEMDMLDLSTKKSGKHAGPVSNDFDLKALHLVFKIPLGEVKTYKEVAESMESRAWRAVGSAMARNPFPLVIPCHRVVRSDLNLGNYGGGVEMKKELLKKEGVKIKGQCVIRP